jgi:cytidylate kinase
LNGKRIIVAIDGPAGAGKSTLARRLADKLGFVYVDTGAMYRAVALWALRANIPLTDMHRLEQLAREARIEFVAGRSGVLLNGEDVTEPIRAPEVSNAASKIAPVPAVRRALVDKQRQIGRTSSAVIEGRDIGSVVFPEAQIKIFLDAAADVRADRRARETEQPRELVSRQLLERDNRDRRRAESPLVQAPDAVYIDTSGLSIDEVERELLKIVRERTSNGKERTH